MKFNELVEIMSSNGVVNLADIARELGVSPQSVSNWKARDRVPYKYVVEVQNRFNVGQSTDGSGAQDVLENSKKKQDGQEVAVPLTPFKMEKEKTFHLSDVLTPIADSVDIIIKSTISFFLLGFIIYKIVTMIPEEKVRDIDLIYISQARLIIPGMGTISQSDGGEGGVIGQLLGLDIGGHAGSGAASLTSPAIWPEFLSSHSFLKRMMTTKYSTQKYDEEKTLIEIAMLKVRERSEKRSFWDRFGESNNFDPGDWIELYNIGDDPINLVNWSISDETSGNTFSISNDYILPKGEYVVLCYDTTKFKQFFPQVKNYLGNLNFGFDESGEKIILRSSNSIVIDSLMYDDRLPWPIEADGMGKSLELVNPYLNNSDPKNWSASDNHGSPGQKNYNYNKTEIPRSDSQVVINELNYNSLIRFDTEISMTHLDTLIMLNAYHLEEMVKFLNDGSFITLRVSSFEPKLSVDISYVLLDELMKFSQLFQNKNLQEKRQYIEDRINIIGKELDIAREEYRVFTETNRTISSLRLEWELQKVQQQVDHYQGIYTGLISQLENVKIQQSDKSESEPLIVDYPIPPINHMPLPVSGVRSFKFVILLTLAGLGFGFIITFSRAYFSIVDENEKRRLKDVNRRIKSNILKLIPSIRIGSPIKWIRSFRS